MTLKTFRFALAVAAVLSLAALAITPREMSATAVVPILLETTASGVAGSCESGERCVEQCTRYPNGTEVPMGYFCCAPDGSIGVPGVTCGSVGGIAGRFDGPV